MSIPTHPRAVPTVRVCIPAPSQPSACASPRMPARPIPGQDTGVIGHFVLQGSVPRVADRHNRLQGGAVGRTGGCLGPFTAQVNPIGGAWAGLPTLHLSGPAVHHRASTATSRAQVTPAVSTEPPAQRQVVRPTRFAHPHSWSHSTKTPTFPHQHAEKSPHQQHVVSYNPQYSQERGEHDQLKS